MSTTVPLRSSLAPSQVAIPLDGLAEFPGAAAVLSRDGSLGGIAGTQPALLETLQMTGAWPGFALAAGRAIDGCRAIVEIAGAPISGNAIEATLLPLGDGRVLALCRPIGFESALTASLAESRQRFKDLVSIAADFAWETDGGGRFTFVSPEGALDWPAGELAGRPVEPFLAEMAAGAGADAFRSAVPLRDAEVWFRRRGGGSECLAVTAAPLFAADGSWRGARGLCRIVTAAAQRAGEAARARLHDRLIGHLSRTLRDEIDIDAALAAALSAAALAMAASGGAVIPENHGGIRLGEIRWGGEIAVQLIDEGAAAVASGGEIDLLCDGVHLLGGATLFRGERNGAVLFWRAELEGPFSAEDHAILRDAAAPFGAAIARSINEQAALALSRSDPLTGLLNRRGFLAEAARRISRLARQRAPASLLYIDLDNFKLVNDAHGHQAGDEALRRFAEILHDNSRSGDLIARLGGDEFVMWLEGAGEAVAEQRAAAIVGQCYLVAGLSGDTARPLGASIGVVTYRETPPEDAEALVARADAAMYRAKRAGGAKFVPGP